MVYKTRVGIAFYISLIFILITILFIGSLIFLSELVWAKVVCGLICALLAAVLVFHIIPMITNTFYRLDEDGLFIKTGRTNVVILYANIIDITCGVKSMLMQPALAFNNRLEIKYKTSGGMTDIVHLSPVGEDAFVSLIKNKCEILKETKPF